MIEQKQKTSPKDVFMHLLSIITLYSSAGAFIMLIFSYIDVWLPDPLLKDYYALQSINSSIRWSIAVLIVVFPVYVLVSWYLNKLYLAVPSKRNLRIRKWLIYFTLFAAALIIMGDLVSLIFNFLGGELTIKFLLKILTVFFVAGAVFFYYFWDLRKHRVE